MNILLLIFDNNLVLYRRSSNNIGFDNKSKHCIIVTQLCNNKYIGQSYIYIGIVNSFENYRRNSSKSVQSIYIPQCYKKTVYNNWSV